MSKSELQSQVVSLSSHYITLEEYYLRCAVNKAVACDDVDETRTLTSTVVDDSFFIFSKCSRCRRAANASREGEGIFFLFA